MSSGYLSISVYSWQRENVASLRDLQIAHGHFFYQYDIATRLFEAEVRKHKMPEACNIGREITTERIIGMPSGMQH
jgi:hypothetical protein